ncbi:MAG: sigma-70 family RNA polymerase sigma factor [Acutalibacteraceae bacterium]
MTKEELAKAIQNGESERTAELWETVKRFIMYRAGRYIRNENLCARFGVTEDDFEQTGFIALCEAIKSYDEGKAKFTTHLDFYLNSHFRELIGLREKRKNADPLNNAISLDKPITNDDGDEVAMYQMIPDEESGALFEKIENEDYIKDLRATLDKAIERLPNNRERDAITSRYYDGERLATIGKRYGGNENKARQIIHSAFRHIRISKSGVELRRFLDEERSSAAYRGTGFSAWKFSGASSVERAAEKLERLEKRMVFDR